ncbi:hypothetical protein Taro_020554 [Colocasia esculenta]|uniref:Uncharacterized protein n=1 Tax=Colocasia esculenta TaxID=4460 RepID=A0A843V2G8_COLES|nr:hypothetical protein [Colocasia esculenta]
MPHSLDLSPITITFNCHLKISQLTSQLAQPIHYKLTTSTYLTELVKCPVDLHYVGLQPEDPIFCGSSSGSGPSTHKYGSCTVVGNNGILMRSSSLTVLARRGITTTWGLRLGSPLSTTISFIYERISRLVFFTLR